MSAPSPFDAAVTQILTGTAPRNLRSAAARGALPLTRSLLAKLYLHLRTDEDGEIRVEAEQSLAQLDRAAVLELLGESGCPADVLQHFANRAVHDESLAEKVAFHSNSPDAALLLLAKSGNSTVVELLLTNQERLLTVTGLLDLLMINPALQTGQRARILEVLERAALSSERAARREEVSGAVDGPGWREAEEAARLLSVDIGELLSGSEIIDAEEFETAQDPALRDAFRRILSLSTAAKAILAMKGGREERTILVRDTNKVVCLGVLRNPRLTETEVEKIAQMRNVTDEVLRLIGTNREWSKSYVVARALVLNPKTPPGISTNFVARLNTRDLKNLTRSRDVPELIRRMAKRTVEQRNQPARGPKGR